MLNYKIHEIRFYKPVPSAIISLACNQKRKVVAVLRANSNIELWNFNKVPFLEYVITKVSSDKLAALGWCNDRLFSIGSSGYLYEFDWPSTGSTKSSVSVGYGSAWSLACHNKTAKVAVGTEQGFIVIYDTSSTDVDYTATLSKHEGPVICLAWHPSENKIVSGSKNYIFIWDVDKGTSEALHMPYERQLKETYVWTIGVLSDFTIISGDSHGRACFWDGKTATLISSYKAHQADVLSMSISKDENSAFIAGVDPVIVEFSRVESEMLDGVSKRQWVKSVQRALHTHDVRALTQTDEFLVSGGMDCNLTLSKYPPKICMKYAPFSRTLPVKVAKEAASILFQYNTKVELWKLGRTNSQSGRNGEILQTSKGPTHILDINCKDGEVIVYSCISSDARYVAFSTESQLRMFSVNLEQTSPLSKVALPSDAKLPSSNFIFHKNLFYYLNGEGNIVSLKIENNKAAVEFSLCCQDMQRINVMNCSYNGEYLALGSSSGKITVYDLHSRQIHCQLPQHKTSAVALSFHPRNENLVVVYSDHEVIEFDIHKQAYTPWSRKESRERNIAFGSNHSILNIVHDPKNPDVIIFYSENSIYFLRKCKDPNKREASIIESVKNFKYIIYFDHVADDEFIIVEVTPNSIVPYLSHPFSKKKYGT